MSLRLQIHREVCGSWSVHGLSPAAVAHLPSLSASLDYARRECAAAPATIELLIDGFYAVVYQDSGWRCPPLVRAAQRPRQMDGVTGTDCRPLSYIDAPSVARSRSSWFIDWRARTIRSIAALASGFVAMKRSKSAFRKVSSRQ